MNMRVSLMERRRRRRRSWDVRELRSLLGWGWGYMGWTITSRDVSLRLHNDILPLLEAESLVQE
jgi:hypothetical protein